MTFRLAALFRPAGFAEAAEPLNESVLAMGVDIQPDQSIAGGVEDVSAVGAPAGIAVYSGLYRPWWGRFIGMSLFCGRSLPRGRRARTIVHAGLRGW